MTTQIIMPPAEVYVPLRDAAVRFSVPWTLLTGIAWVESTYQPRAIGPVTKAGWTAKGMMQLSPATIERYSVRDPFDPAQSAMAAAEFVGHLARGLAYDWRRVAYAYNMGAKALLDHEGSGKPMPSSVVAYADKVLAGRDWIQHQVQPVGANEVDRLNNAINGLAVANPASADAVALRAKWKAAYADTLAWFATHYAPLSNGLFRAAWAEYARIYDRAAMTDGGTPPPDTIAPSLWEQLKSLIVAPQPHDAPQPYDYAAKGGGGGGGVMLLALGLLLMLGFRR
jgi:hypothetical protein